MRRSFVWGVGAGVATVFSLAIRSATSAEAHQRICAEIASSERQLWDELEELFQISDDDEYCPGTRAEIDWKLGCRWSRYREKCQLLLSEFERRILRSQAAVVNPGDRYIWQMIAEVDAAAALYNRSVCAACNYCEEDFGRWTRNQTVGGLALLAHYSSAREYIEEVAA